MIIAVTIVLRPILVLHIESRVFMSAKWLCTSTHYDNPGTNSGEYGVNSIRMYQWSVSAVHHLILIFPQRSGNVIGGIFGNLKVTDVETAKTSMRRLGFELLVTRLHTSPLDY